MLSSLYRELFISCSLQLSPPTLASQLLATTDMCRGSKESALLWLSLVRRIFTPAEATPPPPTDAMSTDCDSESLWSSFMISTQSSLLQSQSFVPFLISNFASEDQLVSYLASEVLLLVVHVSQHLEEDWLEQVFSLVCHPNHGCLYSIQLLKKLLKSIRKGRQFPDKVVLNLYSFLLSRWQAALAKLSSDNVSSKWPELNLIAFLSMSGELLQCPPQCQSSGAARDCSLMVASHLEELTVSVTKKHTSLISLRALLKFYAILIRNLTGLPSETRVVAKTQLKNCLPRLFVSNDSMLDVLASVHASLSRDTDCSNGGDLCGDGLKRSLARKAVVLLMKYACLLENQLDYFHLEDTLITFSGQCKFLSSSFSLPDVRHSLFCLLSEQDDTILDVLSASCQLWKKKDLWLTCPTLQFCFSATHLHFMMLEFLQSVCYDHSLLLDFLVSPETRIFESVLLEYLHICASEWSSFVVSCREMGSGDQHDDVTSMEVPVMETSTGIEETYKESTVDKVMDCFTKLAYALDRLSASQLLPFSPDRLRAALSQAETLYENT